MKTRAARAQGFARLSLLYTALLAAPAAVAQISVSLEPSVPSPVKAGTLVTFTAKVDDISPGEHWYRFITRGFDQPRRIVKDFGPDDSFDWVPHEREGFYTIEVQVRNRSTGFSAVAIAPFQVRSNVVGNQPVVTPTHHPLVMLYSAPPCPPGGQMTVYYSLPGGMLQSAPAKPCDGIFSMNFYIAGLRPRAQYTIKHIVRELGAQSEGPQLSFTAGEAPGDLARHTATGTSTAPERGVVLGGSLMTNFVATDLDGNLIWYYPKNMLFLTHPEPGGYFFGVDEVEGADQSRQILRMFNVAGTTVLETNAARVNEQLLEAGKRPINGFHHEARLLSNGNIVTLGGVEQILTDVQGPGRVNVLGEMIIVLNRDLEVVWTWDAFEHLDVTRMATQGDVCAPAACPPLYLDTRAADWLHANAITETPEGNFLVSLRSQDWVIKVEYLNGAGTGEVLWRLGEGGDFTIDSRDPNPWFSHQHDAEVEEDGTISIFDNGNVRRASDPNANSRGQVFRLDEANRVAHLVMNADLGQYAFALGSAQRLENGSYFFDVGFLLDGAGVSVEVDRSGRIVYSIRSTAPEYRTFRLKDMYNP